MMSCTGRAAKQDQQYREGPEGWRLGKRAASQAVITGLHERARAPHLRELHIREQAILFDAAQLRAMFSGARVAMNRW